MTTIIYTVGISSLKVDGFKKRAVPSNHHNIAPSAAKGSYWGKFSLKEKKTLTVLFAGSSRVSRQTVTYNPVIRTYPTALFVAVTLTPCARTQGTSPKVVDVSVVPSGTKFARSAPITLNKEVTYKKEEHKSIISLPADTCILRRF